MVDIDDQKQCSYRISVDITIAASEVHVSGCAATFQLHHEIDRAAEGPALVLMHPLGADLGFWAACRALWVGRRTVLAYDRPGAGASPPPPAPQSAAANVADLEALRAQLGLATIVPVGVAIGAMLAAAYAAEHPEHVAGLVLCNPATALSPAGREMTIRRVERLRAHGIDGLLPDAVDRAFNGLPQDDRYQAYLAAFRRNDPLGYERSALAAMEIDIADDLRRVRCPTLVVAGSLDVLFPPTEARKTVALVPNATYVELPTAAHFPPFQTPWAFVAEVDAFLQRCRRDVGSAA
jgi:pimeloyl-ACP methyl ester carboxylesterase